MKYHLHKFIVTTVLTMFAFQAYSLPIVENQTYECKTISMTLNSRSNNQEKNCQYLQTQNQSRLNT